LPLKGGPKSKQIPPSVRYPMRLKKDKKKILTAKGKKRN